jgi:hypothetical protein
LKKQDFIAASLFRAIDFRGVKNKLYVYHSEFDQNLVDEAQGTSINSNLVENSYGRAALSAFVCLQ